MCVVSPRVCINRSRALDSLHRRYLHTCNRYCLLHTTRGTSNILAAAELAKLFADTPRVIFSNLALEEGQVQLPV